MSILRIAFIGLVQAIGLAVYCWLVALLLYSLSYYTNVNDPILGVVFMLMLFVVSAVISGLIVLGYPGYLVWKQRLFEAIPIVIATLAWAVIILGVVIVVAVSSTY